MPWTCAIQTVSAEKEQEERRSKCIVIIAVLHEGYDLHDTVPKKEIHWEDSLEDE